MRRVLRYRHGVGEVSRVSGERGDDVRIHLVSYRRGGIPCSTSSPPQCTSHSTPSPSPYSVLTTPSRGAPSALPHPNVKMAVENINALDAEGNTAAHRAAMEGNVEALKAAQQAGADLNLRNKDGKTAAMLAAGAYCARARCTLFCTRSTSNDPTTVSTTASPTSTHHYHYTSHHRRGQRGRPAGDEARPVTGERGHR